MRVENPVATAPGTVPGTVPAYSTASGSELVFNHGCSGLDSHVAVAFIYLIAPGSMTQGGLKMKHTKAGNQTGGASLLTDPHQLRRCVNDTIAQTPVIDMHTHLFAPQFGPMNLWGIDDLLTYHYLIAELFHSSDITLERFWKLTKTEQADLIWDALFVRNTPLSEATRGVVAVLDALGLDARVTNLKQAREFFRAQSLDSYLNNIMERSGVSEIVMTNDPFDDGERPVWENGIQIDARFHAALRLDPLLSDWERSVPKMTARGYQVDPQGGSLKNARRFLEDWIDRMKPLYLAVSLPDDFKFPENSIRGRLLRDVVLPTCRERDLPFSMMIGVRRAVNPALRMAGDALGRADLQAVVRLCADYPDNRFLVTVLSRENQHELCVIARKFSNVMVFGCWWFVNNPSIVYEITRERFEMLGTGFIPQHSDARVLDQLLYKWPHSRRIIADVLYDSYHRLLEDGWPVTRQEIERDVTRLFSGNFRRWVGLPTT